MVAAIEEAKDFHISSAKGIFNKKTHMTSGHDHGQESKLIIAAAYKESNDLNNFIIHCLDFIIIL